MKKITNVHVTPAQETEKGLRSFIYADIEEDGKVFEGVSIGRLINGKIDNGLMHKEQEEIDAYSLFWEMAEKCEIPVK